jgi:transposase
MNNDIIKLLNIVDEDIEIVEIVIVDLSKYIHIRKKVVGNKVCPNCGCVMYSKGVRKREINHPVLQDGFHLYLVLHQRKWRCTNSECNHYCNDYFSFIEKYKQSTNILPFLVLEKFKDINATDASVARDLNISDNSVRYIFRSYVDLGRLPLSEAISIDEVYMHFDSKNLYSLIIMDFISGEIIDILPNRLESTTNKYFYSISKEERDRVKYLICDMYNPYINYVNKYFKNAICIIDSFHVIQWIVRELRNYINDLKKKYREEEKEKLEEKNMRNNTSYKTSESSNELYLLNNYSFFLLGNNDNIKYEQKRYYNHKFKMYLNTYQLEEMFFSIDKNLKIYSDLKQLYHDFNKDDFNTLEDVEIMLETLIIKYRNCGYKIFRDFAELLEKHKQLIVNSFIKVEVVDSNGEYVSRRLSNGPMESFNNFPKDYKYVSNGVSNFEYTRNRILWATRKNPSILGVPKILPKTNINKRK